MPALRQAVRSVAIFEALKGLLAICAMLGLLSLLHHDLHHLAVEWMDHLGLSPHHGVAAWVLQTADRINATPVRTLELVGSAYAAARWLEAWGLWQDKAWGEWLGVLSCGLYLPLEIAHLLHKPSWQAGLVLLVNLGLIAVLALRLRQRRRA
ncbi:MAG: DUF2127 domain-containing protein [Acidovorax sp.]|jgi:uncharacterized membrane protein (DUF2068 family)|nr:DUF2127 domain-containing protein [Acidovorax sp.]